MSHTQHDLILIFCGPNGPFVSPELWEKAISDLESRLESVLSIHWYGDRETVKAWIATHASPNRIVVVPFTLFEPSRFDIWSGLWFAGVPSSTTVFLAKPPSATEVGTWIRNGVSSHGDTSHVELIPPPSADTQTIDHLAAIAYWVEGQSKCRIRGDRRIQTHTASATDDCLYYPFSSDEFPIHGGATAQGAVVQRGPTVKAWNWIAPDTLATWLIGRYLQALNAHPIAFSPQPAEQSVLSYLKSLADQQYSILPTDYAGRLDAIAPSSMGSASLIYDEEGSVPWDRIWTSFCDLAMAGGPPHRGSLLANVPIEDIARQRAQYDLVVAELRRGIELASRLPTLESSIPGWVGVRCHDERMAAWMLRAIIVENILVRREGSILFLPAGPEFRIEKEIKNVITAVAKTTHYWFGHLKVRQPPNPL
ncbi:MAG: hypothetical protein KGQ51_10305 [Planctomycetes bacterium]|nr:hypothetical protein [Planctomycetota bacterium]